MKSSLIALLLLLFCENAAKVVAQTPDPEAYGEKIVELDMGAPVLRFNKILPFDRQFIFHLKNIPSAYSTISISIVENKQATSQRRKKSGGGSEAKPATGVVLTTNGWTRPNGGSGITEADINQMAHLKPNRDYIVTIEAGTLKTLTATQEIELGRALLADASVTTIVNQLGWEPASSGGKVITTYREQLNKTFEAAINAYDPGYVFNRPEWTDLLSELNTFREEILNASGELDSWQDDLDVNDPNYIELKRQIKAINWGTLQEHDALYRSIEISLSNLEVTEKAKAEPEQTVLGNLTSFTNFIVNALKARDALVNKMMVDVVLPNTSKISVLNSTSLAGFVDAARLHLNLDVGYAYVGRIDRAMAYTGFNIYFRPVDKSIRLSTYKTLGEQLAVRSSFLLGITTGSVEKEGVRKGLIDNKALVLGAGFRVISFLKVNGGVFCHYRFEQNPVIDRDRYRFSMSPFVSISIDLDVKSLFTGFSDAVFK